MLLVILVIQVVECLLLLVVLAQVGVVWVLLGRVAVGGVHRVAWGKSWGEWGHTEDKSWVDQVGWKGDPKDHNRKTSRRLYGTDGSRRLRSNLAPRSRGADRGE